MSSGVSAINLGLEAMQLVPFRRALSSEFRLHFNASTFNAVEHLLSWDGLNRFQEKSRKLNFRLQGEQAFAKFIAMKHACAWSSVGGVVSLGLEAMQRMLSPAGFRSEIRVQSNVFTSNAVEHLLTWGCSTVT